MVIWFGVSDFCSVDCIGGVGFVFDDYGFVDLFGDEFVVGMCE